MYVEIILTTNCNVIKLSLGFSMWHFSMCKRNSIIIEETKPYLEDITTIPTNKIMLTTIKILIAAKTY